MNRVCSALAVTVLLSLASQVSGTAHAESYPSRPIRIIVPLAPGGLSDMFARAVAQRLGAAAKQPVVVENRTGAGGAIAAEIVAKSPADGYTLFMGSHPTLAVLPHLRTSLPYDPDKDFAPIIQIVMVPNLLVVHPSVPARSITELMEHAKRYRGHVTFASQGPGSSGHITGEQFKQTAGIDIVHVPYRGAALAAQDLLAGHVSMMFDSVTLQIPNVTAGKVRALAVLAPQRVSVLPDVPTIGEVGLPELQGGAWFGLLAPAGTPREAIQWINAEARKAFATTEARQRFLSQGALLPLGTPEDFAAHIARERQRWGEVIRRAGIQAE